MSYEGRTNPVIHVIMRRGRPGRLEVKKIAVPFVFVLSFFVAAPAWAQAKPPTPKPSLTSDVSPQARAFQALSEADRKAAQDALGWLGFYNGVNDGAAGKRTFDAISAYQKDIGVNTDGIVTATQLAMLKEAAGKAKAAVGFRLVEDAGTGIRIGAPVKVLEKRESAPGAASLVSKDGAVGLYMKETSGELAALYKTLSADAGARKVSYKFLKTDAFFVTAGEEGDSKFYRRYAAGEGRKLRGFAFLYPKAKAKVWDPVALAIANSFDPFPSAPLPPTASPTPTPTPTPEAPKLAATALIVAPGVAVTALDAKLCKAPSIGGKPVRFLEGEGGLTRLGGEFGVGAAAVPVGPTGSDLVALSLGGAKLEVSVVQAVGDKVIAALAPGASGAPLFDRAGRLVAFVAPFVGGPRRAGVPLAAPHATIAAAGLGAPTAGEANLTAPEIAKLRRAAVVGVFCGA